MDIIVLLQGTHERVERRTDNNLENSFYPICSSVTLLKNDVNMLVDTGHRGFAQHLIARLHECGMNPEDIDVVFNTHSHFDHISNNHLFTNATIVHGNSVWSSRRVDVYKIISLPMPKVTVLKTPGHYQDHQSILVKTEQTYVIAGDAVREDIIRTTTDWHNQNEDYKQSVNKIFEIADVIIPGHGRIIDGETLSKLQQILTAS